LGLKTSPERESPVTLMFESDGDGTLMILMHEQFFDEARAIITNRDGMARWRSSKSISPENHGSCTGRTPRHPCTGRSLTC
jgi:hypothetical protein